MEEFELLCRAKTYIDKLANGINPLNDQLLDENDVVNNVRLSRCFFYVSGILQKEIDRESRKTSKEKRQKQIPFFFTQEQLESFEYSKEPIPVSEIAKRICAMVDDENMARMIELIADSRIYEYAPLCAQSLNNAKLHLLALLFVGVE